ncbi:amino acid adenylation domain-containing protein [Streptomyces triticirhizae]|uniref:Amino acid adenylation domain-containing protein n=1 Tax=Streptomyces triticirhizae TaxID=2483353 RepID=A0A3M2LT15_9ACTN|nr:amino acid adenylation domain-containing protein [Streptomyces triticirhizae]RMI40629.1 amino acid adenylation domain-containing protein [Streptomyces triticirhizae]
MKGTSTDERTLHDWFAASVAAHGDQPALEVAGERLTYAELNATAARLAARVVASHGSPPARVGLLAARSVTAYAGYLAVQRLGATVVPLGPSFPLARNAAVAEGAGLDLVIADAKAPAEADALPVPVLRADASAEGPLRSGPVPEPHGLAAGPDDLAYILFTSGSTGRPKGVPVAHRNVAAYLGHVIPRYQLGPGARVSQTFDLTFDPSVYDMFAAWGSGAALVVPSAADLMSPVRFVNRTGITHWNSVPSVISIARRLRGLAADSMPSLRWSLFCGEALTLDNAGAWRAAAPDSVLENIYGPTEMTVTWTEFRLPRYPSDWPSPANGTVPIGRPYPDQEHLVLGEDGRPAEDGELCVRGTQRFPGYLDPAENAGRFYAYDPAGDAPATAYDGTEPLTDRHWYRTGDRVTRLDGELVHLGRIDHQLKIRGYRVELGEIESVLRQRPGVTEAVVLAVRGPDGELGLEAVVCADVPLDTGPLLAAVGERLPRYMVPRGVAVRDELPLNANGKVDRAALTASLTGATV